VRAIKLTFILLGLATAITVGLFLYFGPLGPASPYHRFHKQNTDYYARLARACASVFQQHRSFSRHQTSGKPLELQHVWMDATNGLWDDFVLSPKDPALPDTIQALHPDEILITPKSVFIGFGVSTLSWGIVWAQDEHSTNHWLLLSDAEDVEYIVYDESK